MAVVLEGFSIREYAAKMRSVDVVRCWPFGRESDEISKEVIQLLLPPITVSKFHWWSHELDLLRSRKSLSFEENPQRDEEITTNDTDSVTELPEDGKLVEEEKLDLVCPVSRDFTGATVNAVNEHIDSCLAQTSREERRQMRLAVKGKSRALKKRSILEIFSVSQQIEKVEVDDDNLDIEVVHEPGLDSANVEFNMNIDTKKKKQSKKVKAVNKLIKTKKKKKKKLKNKSLNSGLIAKNKVKLQTPVKFTRKLNDSLCKKGLPKEILDSVAIHGKKHLKRLSIQNKRKVVQKSKLKIKHLEPVISVQSILKKHKKAVPGLTASICSLQAASQMNPCGIQHSDRRVRFSGKDDILGSRKHSFSPFEKSSCNLCFDAFASSSDVDRSTESQKESATIKGLGDDITSINTENGTGVQHITEEDSFHDGNDCVNLPNLLRSHATSQENLKHLPEKSLYLSQVLLPDDNLRMFDRGNQISSHKSPYAGFPKLLSALNEIRNPCVDSRFCGTVSRSSNSGVKFIDDFENRSHGVAEMSSVAKMRGYPQPSSSGFTLNGSANIKLPSAAESMTCEAFQPFSHLSAMEVGGSLYRFPKWKQGAVSFRQNSINDEFFGLPLNSQGELTQAITNDKGSFNPLNKLSLVTGSSSRSPVEDFDQQRCMGHYFSMKDRDFVESGISKDQINMISVENCLKENPNLHLPARLGVAWPSITAKDDFRWLNSGSTSNHSINFLDLDQNLVNSSSGFKQYDQLQNQDRGRVIHPKKKNSDPIAPNATHLTMRLMGKDVAIGRSSKQIQGLPDRKVWTEQEIMAERRSSGSVPDDLSVKGHIKEDCHLNPIPGKPNQPLEVQRHETPLSKKLLNALDSKSFHPFVNWKNNAVFQNGMLPINRNHSPHLHDIAYPPTFPVMFNSATNFHEPSNPGPELGVSSQLPSISTSHINQVIDWSPADLKYKPSFPPQATKSAFNFPFLHPDCSEPVPQSWFQSSSNRLLPWLLPAARASKAPMVSSPPFADMDVRYYPHATELNLLSIPSVVQPPVTYSFNPMTSQSHMQSSLVPALSGIKPTSSIETSYRNSNIVIDRTRSKTFGIQDLTHCQKLKKRSAPEEDYSTRLTKKPNLGIHKDLSAVTELRREDCSRNIQCNAGASEFNSNRDRASSSGWRLFSKEGDAPTIAGLASKHLSQDLQYNDGPPELNSNSVEASDLGFVPNKSQRIGVRTSAGNDASRGDGMGKSGPVKLSAGAKHILKPWQIKDQDNSRLVHSTIPFAAVPNSNILFESQKKSKKAYRF